METRLASNRKKFQRVQMKFVKVFSGRIQCQKPEKSRLSKIKETFFRVNHVGGSIFQDMHLGLKTQRILQSKIQTKYFSGGSAMPGQWPSSERRFWRHLTGKVSTERDTENAMSED